MAAIVTLLTDFGRTDPYLAEVKAALYRQWARFPAGEPTPRVVDLTHDIPPGDVAAAAWFLRRVAGQFPVGTVHLAVVDPGVGTARPAVAAAADGRFYLAPGNGLLAFLTGSEELVVRRLDLPLYRQPPPGLPPATTFDGRDLFAPVAAHLALGVPLAQVGSPAEAAELGLAPASTTMPAAGNESRLGQIVWIDRFGNAVTDVTRRSVTGRALADGVEVRVAGHRVSGPVRTFADGSAERPFWYWGSADTLEIALRGESAAARLQLGRGMAIERVDPYD